MTPKRIFYGIVAGIVILSLAIFGGTYAITNSLQSRSSHLVDLKAKLGAINQEQTSLTQAKKEVAAYTDLYNIAKVVVPANKDQAQTVRQIVKLASDNSVSLDSITFPSSSLGSSPTGIAAPTGNLGSATAVGGNPKLSQLTPVPKIAGVYDLPITVASATEPGRLATYPQLIGFLGALEKNRLTALVSSISISPNPQNRSYFSFTLTMNAYIKPGS